MSLSRPPERSPERDAALVRAVAHVPELGWGWRALAAGLREDGMEAEAARLEAELLFPGGAADMVEAFIDLADREMAGIAAEPGFAELRTTARVRRLVLGRLEGLVPHREAVRRSLAVLAHPRHARIAAGTLARTVDEIWHLAGDQAADFSWYTKRALLAGVYTATLLFWLRDDSDDLAATSAFLDRRLAGVGRIGKLRGQAEARLAGLRERMRPAA
jgi:ubiquinone biosynthesis protein COQ9